MAGPAFRFRFQKILDVREQKERALEIEVGRLDMAVAQQKEDLACWQRVRAQTLEHMRNARTGSDFAQDAQSTDYLLHVRGAIQACRAQIDELARARQKARRDLERAMQSRKVLENYRDRLKREFIAAEERSQERVLDLHSLRKFMQAEGAL